MASVDNAPPVVLKDLRTGEYFGELALFDDKPRSASVRAVVDAVLLELTREELAEQLGRSKRAAMAILSEMAERLLPETNAMLSQRAAKDVVREFEENLTWSQRLADKVATLNGSWAFILLLMGMTAGWCVVNMPPVAKALGLYSVTDGKITGFDPYPFILYNLVLAVLVSLQGPLIVMSQNRQSAKDRAKADVDFHVNLKNEIGIEEKCSPSWERCASRRIGASRCSSARLVWSACVRRFRPRRQRRPLSAR